MLLGTRLSEPSDKTASQGKMRSSSLATGPCERQHIKGDTQQAVHAEAQGEGSPHAGRTAVEHDGFDVNQVSEGDDQQPSETVALEPLAVDPVSGGQEREDERMC